MPHSIVTGNVRERLFSFEKAIFIYMNKILTFEYKYIMISENHNIFESKRLYIIISYLKNITCYNDNLHFSAVL